MPGFGRPYIAHPFTSSRPKKRSQEAPARN
jgi:hypothetical protein